MTLLNHHQPVLLKETIQALVVKNGGIYLDATLGHAGHSQEILKLGGQVYGIDQDPQSLKISQKRLEACPLPTSPGRRRSQGAFIPILGNFKNLKEIAQKHQIPPVDGILFDLGLNTLQIKKPGGGFSFTDDQSLDMRLDPSSSSPSAKEILNTYPEREISHLLSSLSQETKSDQIARLIVLHRPFQSAQQLADLIKKNISPKGHTHPATQTFLALRIYVNQEFENLKTAFSQAVNLLAPSGRLCFITFHSGEDRIVKLAGQQAVSQNLLKTVSPYPLKPSAQEVKENPLSRSAILRVFEKI
jgi:16S rRNA (cytosine1402-N4)-methyltransferase